MNNRWIVGLMAFALVGGAGCSSMYYGAMESVGIAKRDLMVSRVEGARDSQQDAKKEFANALEQFKSVVNTPGGNLEAKYKKLSQALQKSEASATEIRDRIASIESVSGALFKEWKTELKQYDNADLRRSSENQLKASQTRYKSLITAMKQAESRLEPALKPLRDQVLYLKHNLNAQAIGALTDEAVAIETRVDDLVRDMDAAIQEADAFIATLNKG